MGSKKTNKKNNKKQKQKNKKEPNLLCSLFFNLNACTHLFIFYIAGKYYNILCYSSKVRATQAKNNATIWLLKLCYI